MADVRTSDPRKRIDSLEGIAAALHERGIPFVIAGPGVDAAKDRFIDVGLELGGNDAAYVAADADLEKAVEGIVDGACYNAGQSCCAVERVYVHRSVYDKFIEAALPVMRAYVMGNPRDAKTNLGPIAQAWHPDELEKQVEDAVKRGAKLLLGGKKISVNGKGRFFEPTVLIDVPDDALVMSKESFGPILPIAPVDDDEHAIKLINDDDLGLTGDVLPPQVAAGGKWGRRVDRSRDCARTETSRPIDVPD
jgi:acyl-CoA reductase-like NAD-dependent aldehyde dehydrogenase